MLAKCWFCWDEEHPSDLDKIKCYIAKKSMWECVLNSNGGTHCRTKMFSLILKVSRYPFNWAHNIFPQIPLFIFCTLLKFRTLHFSSLLPIHFTSPNLPSFLSQPLPTSFIMLCIISHFLLGQLAAPPSLPLCFYFSQSVPFVSHSALNHPSLCQQLMEA